MKMVCLKILVVYLIVINVNHFVDCSVMAFDSNITNIKIRTVNNLTDFLNENPEQQLEPMPKEVNYDECSQTFQIVHKFGERNDGEYFH